MNFYHLLQSYASRSPERVLFVEQHSGGTLTSRDALAVCEALRKKFEPLRGARIALVMRNDPLYLIVLIALWSVGCVPVLISTRWLEAQQQDVIHELGCSGVVTLSDAQAWSSRVCLHRCDGVRVSAGYTGEAPALVMFTSGSTGQPKAVPLTWCNLESSMQQFYRGLRLDHTLTVAAVAPLYHGAGLLTLTLPLFALGAKVVTFPRFDVDLLARAVHEEGVDAVFMVPTMWQRTCASDAFAQGKFDTLRVALTGGARTALPVLQAWRQRGVELVVGYGMTESSPAGTFAHAEHWSLNPLSVGVSDDLLRVKIVNANEDGVGQVALRGLNLMMGYLVYKQWENVFCCDKSCFDDEGYFLSPDVGRMENTQLVLLGRMDDVINSGGEKISPDEVEAALEEVMPDVRWCVVGVPDEEWGEVVTAFYVGPRELDVLVIRRALEGMLPGYKAPRMVLRCEDFPVGATGKVDRRALIPHVHQGHVNSGISAA